MISIKTPKFRVSYPNVFKARINPLNGKEEYSVEALFDKDADLSELKEAAKKAVIEKWGADQTKWPKNLKMPFRDQAEKEKDGVLADHYEKGAYFLRLKSNRRPGIVDAQCSPIDNETEFYGGCYARASVAVFAYDQAGNRGVSFGLSNLQKIADGEAFSGRVAASDDFEPVGEKQSASPNELFE